MVARIDLEAREYKLLLKPKAFKGGAAANPADAFWDEHIAKIVKAKLGANAGKGEFTERKDRVVRYWDTKRGLLVEHDFTLRERVEAGAGKERKITLKLRSPDLLIASATPLSDVSADKDEVDEKFEEDISPLEVATGRSGKVKVTLADPRSTRSRFARSITRVVPGPNPCADLGKVFELFPTLDAHLRAGGAPPPKEGTRLTSAWAIDETIFRGMKVDLGQGSQAEFTITLWRFRTRAPRRRVAELSYTYKPKNKSEPAIARAALRLFLGLQDGLPDLLDLSSTSKTALALGPRGKLGPSLQRD